MMKTRGTLLAKGRVAVLAMLGLACVSAPKGRPTPAGSSASGPDRPSKSLPIPREMRQQVRNSEIVGRQLYILDKVSAIATDVLMEQVPDFRKNNIGGYLPFQEAGEDLRPSGSFVVTFFTRDEPARVAYEIRVRPNAKPELKSYNPPKVAPSSLVGMAKARQSALDALPAHEQPMNPVLLPAELLGEKGTLVYLIAGTTKPNLAVFGRHYRVLIPERGGPPSYVMPLSKSILELPINAPDGRQSDALLVTHLVTDWPLETHVFVSLLIKKPVYVGSSAGIWLVDGDQISLVSDEKPPKR